MSLIKTNPLCDPFTDPTAARNLKEEILRQSNFDDELIQLAKSIESITSEGMVAVVREDVLFEIGLRLAFESSMNHVYIQVNNHDHWAALCVCSRSGSMVEEYIDEKVYRFYKSPSDKPFLYGDLLEEKILPGCRWYQTVVKTSKIVIPVVEEISQLSLF